MDSQRQLCSHLLSSWSIVSDIDKLMTLSQSIAAFHKINRLLLNKLGEEINSKADFYYVNQPSVLSINVLFTLMSARRSVNQRCSLPVELIVVWQKIARP